MKAILCVNCWDLFSLNQNSGLRTCECGETKARHESKDDHVAIYEGEYGIPVGINNESLIKAIKRQGRRNQDFVSYVVPERNDFFRQVKNLTEESFDEVEDELRVVV